MKRLENKVNLSKIANDLGVSVSTVSRALSGGGRISESTRQKVQDYLEERHLIPNVRKHEYSYIKKNIIAITMPGAEEDNLIPYFKNLLSSVYDYFSARDYQILVLKTGCDDVKDLEEAILEHAMDGVIVSKVIDCGNEIELLKEHGVPFVVIGRTEDEKIAHIEVNEEKACFDLTNTLMKMGYRKMAVFGVDKDKIENKKKIEGMKKACRENQHVLNSKNIFFGLKSDAAIEIAVEKALKEKVECILCVDETICLKTLCVMYKMLVKIPEDICIASLCNSPVLDEWCPPVTCISYDVHKMGKEAGKLLHAILSEKKEVKNVVLDYEIELKGSTKKG